MKTMRTVSKPTKVYAVLFISLMLVMAISPALGKKRSDYLLDYAKSNELANGGFKNSQVADVDTASEIGTFANIYLIQKFGSMDDFNNFSAAEWLKDQLTVESPKYNYQLVYYALAALNLLPDANVTDESKDFVYNYFKTLNTESKFKPNNSDTPTLSNTYYGLMIYYYLGKADELNYGTVSTFISALYDEQVGAFKDTVDGQASLECTYFAIKMLVQMEKMETLSDVRKTEIIAYVNSFYVNDSAYKTQIGGFSRTKNNPLSTMSETFYATQILSALGEKPTEQTKEWVLSLHEPSGGFKETYSETLIHPTALSTYYAVSILELYDFKFDDDIWLIEISVGWIIAIVVICVAALAGIIYLIYYYKNR